MASSPPPYSSTDGYAGHFRYITDEQRPPILDPLAGLHSGFLHPHKLYVTAVPFQLRATTGEAGSSDGSINTLFCWPPDSSNSDSNPFMLPMPGDVNPADLEAVQGFEPCKKLHLPSGHAEGNTADSVRQQARLLLAREVENETATTPQEVEPGSLQMQVYKITAFSEHPTGFLDPSASETPLLFKWTKLSDVYSRLQGFWETDLTNVIKDGSFRGGRQLKILVRCVSDQQLQEHNEKLQQGTRSL